MVGELGLLGVPSSAAAHGPGQEKAPAALRRAGLPERLVAAGVHVVDYGDLPVVRWRPDPDQRRPPPDLKGEVPSLLRRPSGCEFHTRCPYAQERCRIERPSESCGT